MNNNLAKDGSLGLEKEQIVELRALGTGESIGPASQ